MERKISRVFFFSPLESLVTLLMYVHFFLLELLLKTVLKQHIHSLVQQQVWSLWTGSPLILAFYNSLFI